MSKAAFPRPYSKDDHWDREEPRLAQEGMSLREYYAGLIMASITNANNTADEVDKNAAFAVNAAQSLIIKLEQIGEVER